MRFPTEHAHAILRGEKTQHRVLAIGAHIRPGQQHPIQRPRHVDEMTNRERVRYEEGDGHRGHKTIGRLTITNTRLQTLADITLPEIHAEGHRTRAGFARRWMQFPTDDTSSDDDVLELFEDLHASTVALVLEIEPDLRDEVRLLADRNVDADYVASNARALSLEPEAVDEGTQERIAKRAGMASAQWQALEQGHRERQLRELDIDRRVQVARRLAQMRNVDIERQLWIVERLRADGRSDEAVLHKLRGAEDKINRTEEAA